MWLFIVLLSTCVACGVALSVRQSVHNYLAGVAVVYSLIFYPYNLALETRHMSVRLSVFAGEHSCL
jgi:hypothetical protein